MSLKLTHDYVSLGEQFVSRVSPVRVENPGLIAFNEGLAYQLGIQKLAEADIASIFSGNIVPAGAIPAAMAYSGHQFSHFNSQLGDGRALLLGEVVTPEQIFDIHLKGSGQTLYSRNGDGRAALGPVLREYLLSEAMHRLGVPTTRALAAVTTGEQVAREQLLPGGVITRVARSFVRVGTFQYFASRSDTDAVHTLADFVIQRCYRQVSAAEKPYEELFGEIIRRQAQLIAKWMQLGFVHGVMNTDNMAVSGETIDYGPCAFIDDYSHDKVFSSIDRGGRYAYNQQPGIGLWNLTRLAECLLPLFAEDRHRAIEIAESCLEKYQPEFQHTWLAGMRDKCGLSALGGQADSDRQLIEALLNIMHESHADFTLTFTNLCQLADIAGKADAALLALFTDRQAINAWLVQWRTRLRQDPLGQQQRQQIMRSVNPLYIPRNHQIEAAIRAAEDDNDFSLFQALHRVLDEPYTERPEHHEFQLPPRPEQVVEHTFCGT